LMNSLFYTLAVLINGLFCIVVGAAMGVLQHFSTFSHILITIGALTLSGISLSAVLLLWNQSLLWRIANRIFSLLEKLHLMRHPEIRKAKLELLMKQYRECVDLMAEKKRMLVGAFVLNLLQRLSQISVTLSIYMALGGQAKNLFRLYLTQSMCVVGSNCVPIPGSMGVTDYLMVDGFMPIMGSDMAYRVELFARSTAFYICMIVSGLVVLGGFIFLKAKKKEGDNPSL
ncbi:MAG: flippase-like domain-containing protein, partial [Lachnospiraceae bacterium]|nr:flippase-like domain-containing protein [Lachnospiraceae bacterium]